ncbi:MAG: hypothetical protein AB7F43_07405 [Bacteriovoracia bacterium]
MRECTFIFRKLGFLTLLVTLFFVTGIGSAFAQEKKAYGLGGEPGDDQVLSGPFSEYGEFDSAEDEAENERFFQYGRFFGVGLGTGLTSATGNAGKIYQGLLPMISFKLDYWFDFHIALQTVVENSKHNYNLKPDGLTDVNLFRILFQVKYYFDVHDLSAPITFVGPHIIAGGGFYQRTDNIGSGSGDATVAGTLNSQSAFGLNFGGGFEITIKPKKTYLQLEFLAHLIQFGDQYDPKFKSQGIPDRTGAWTSATVGIMWTW